MKILVDTSAWVDFLNGHPSSEGKALMALIAGEHDLCTCGIVVAEVFQGLRREKERQEIETLFRHLTFLEPASVDVYFRAIALGSRSRTRWCCSSGRTARRSSPGPRNWRRLRRASRRRRGVSAREQRPGRFCPPPRGVDVAARGARQKRR